MKKFIVKETGQEIKIGDRGVIVEKKTTPYGEGELVTEVEITKETIHNLIKDGVVEVKEVKSEVEKAEEFKRMFDDAFPAIKKIAKDNQESLSKVIFVLHGLLSISPKAYLNVLIESIANLKNTKAKKGKTAYTLNPVRNYEVTSFVGKSKCPIIFYSEEDAKETYNMLLPLIKILTNGE